MYFDHCVVWRLLFINIKKLAVSWGKTDWLCHIRCFLWIAPSLFPVLMVQQWDTHYHLYEETQQKGFILPYPLGHLCGGVIALMRGILSRKKKKQAAYFHLCMSSIFLKNCFQALGWNWMTSIRADAEISRPTDGGSSLVLIQPGFWSFISRVSCWARERSLCLLTS